MTCSNNNDLSTLRTSREMQSAFDPVGYADRHAEIAKVMARVSLKRLALAEKLERGLADADDARRRNASMPGVLGERWSAFIALPMPEQVSALGRTEFEGMAWQSLLQCSPYF